MKNSIKNQISKSKVIVTIIAIAFISIFSIGCTPTTPTPSPTCSTTNTLFQQVYNNTATASGNVDVVTFDLNVHEYNFRVLSNKVICSVGYQSDSAVSAQPYQIEIIDNTTNTVLYNDSTTFSHTATSYLSVPNITVIVGHDYTIRRTLTNWLGNIGNTVGRMAKSSTASSISFPNSVGDLTITGSTFYQTGSTPTVFNLGIPFIDIVFQ